MSHVLRGVEQSGTLWHESDVLGQHAGNFVPAGEQESRERRCIDRVLDVDDVGEADAPTQKADHPDRLGDGEGDVHPPI
jgi:hypothetical protein